MSILNCILAASNKVVAHVESFASSQFLPKCGFLITITNFEIFKKNMRRVAVGIMIWYPKLYLDMRSIPKNETKII